MVALLPRFYRRRLLPAAAAGLLCLSFASTAAADTSPGDDRAGFSVHVKTNTWKHRLMSTFVLPGEQVTIGMTPKHKDSRFVVVVSDGEYQPISDVKGRWTAPSRPGFYDVVIRQSDPTDSMIIRMWVLIPYQKLMKGYVNGYHIGKYPDIPYRGLPAYNPPTGFLEVTAENADTPLSSHFTLSQFICKQPSGYPKYVVLREHLLLKLELILERVNKAGYACTTFNVLSGYRTPYYNKLIGNVKYSRHQWGGAADIFIDENPRDGMMDDLNRDGVINWKDAAVIYDIVDDMYGEEEYEPYTGGLARYKKTADHGPFVHVDARGFRARWGY